MLSFSTACVRAQLPYDYSRVKGASAPVHAKTVALLPFKDARAAADGSDSADRFEYQGVEYEHTTLDRLSGVCLGRGESCDARVPFPAIDEVVARHLAGAHVFRQIVRVLDAKRAPEADLLISGTVRRMRGYVEAEAPSAKSGRPKNERLVLAEVMLGDIQVRDAKDPEKLLFSMDAGWSMFEPRTGETPPDPWAISSEALYHAVSSLTEELSAADLSGALVVRERVSLAVAGVAGEGAFGALAANPPEGWRAVGTSTGASPVGWRADAPRCEKLALEQRQTVRFHRALGMYRPAVSVWACPRDLHLKYDAREEFPAHYLGDRAGGARYFVLAVGESNWPKAREELAAYLSLVPPERRHIFELPGVNSR